MSDGGAPRIASDHMWRPTVRDRMVARAGHLVWLAIKRGMLPELDGLKCEDCGAPAECYDHRNYLKPLSVDPVCKGCNNRRGPGYPPPSPVDGGQYKKSYVADAKSSGRRWSSVEGGEGYTPIELPIHASPNWQEIEDQAQDMDRRINAVSVRAEFLQRTTKGPIRTARYEYFKARDPWSLEPAP